MKKILVVRYRFIGDMILTIPFLRNLRYIYPDAQIDMLVAPNSGEVIEDCPYVNNFIYFDTTRKHKYENGKGKKKSFWSYVFELRKNKYDKAYVLKRSLSSALLCFFAGIKERIGFDTENRGFFLTKKVKYDYKISKPKEEEITENEEINTMEEIIDRQGLKMLASALRDLNEIIGEDKETDKETLEKLDEVLKGLGGVV